jgi:hypothetical protein
VFHFTCSQTASTTAQKQCSTFTTPGTPIQKQRRAAHRFKYRGSITLKNTGSVRAVDIACISHVRAKKKSTKRDNFSIGAEGQTLFSLVLLHVKDTESKIFLMSSSTFDMKTVTVRPSR